MRQSGTDVARVTPSGVEGQPRSNRNESIVNHDTTRLIAELHATYVRLIDDDRLEEWEELFGEPCRYQVTTRENVEHKLPLGLIECTSRGMLRDRIEALRRVNVYEAHTYSPSDLRACR